MRSKLLLKVSAVALLAGLAACDGNSVYSAPIPAPTPTPTPAATFQSRFGAGFAAIFNASVTSDPVEPAADSVPALNPAADPLDN